MSSRQIKDGRMILRPEVQGLRDIHIISEGVNDRDEAASAVGEGYKVHRLGGQGRTNALTQP